MLILVISIAWHCFLRKWVMYFGLLSLHMVSLFSIQCLVLVIMLASSKISCVVICLFIMSRAFPRPCMLIDRLSSVRLYSFSISTVLILHRLLLWVVSDLFSEGPFLWSILWACIILFFFIILSTGMYPVSDRRIEVGVCWGRYNKVFRALFRIVWICWSSVLVGFHPSAPYVRIGMIMESTCCHTASISMPLNSLLLVSVMIFCVAAWIFFPVLWCVQQGFLYFDHFTQIFIGFYFL